MADWSNPLLTSTYVNFLAEVKARDTDLAVQFDGVSPSNTPVGAIRWDSSANRWKRWSGTAWGELTTTYALTGLSTTGNAAIAGTLSVTGSTSLASATTTTATTDTNSTRVASCAFVLGQAGSVTPLVNGTAAVGTSLRFARQDHCHASDTTRAALASPAFTGSPTAPTATAGTSTTQLATTAFVGTAVGTKAALASPAFTGTPTAPTATAGTNTTQLATTAFVGTAVGTKAALASPAFSGTPTAPTAAAGTNSTQLATTAFANASQICKAWVNFNGTSAVTIRDSYNVSSISDLGTGYYRVNFAAALQDANYCVNIESTRSTMVTDEECSHAVTAAPLATSVTFNTMEGNSTLVDSLYTFVSVFH
jgi:hypothetical protein